jgi:hypothetical protein
MLRGLDTLEARLRKDRVDQIFTEGVTKAGDFLADEVRKRVKRDTGKLQRSITAQSDIRGKRIRIVIQARGLTKPVDQWTEEGTGIYGPVGKPIVPRKAKNLVFYWKRQGVWMRVPSVKGQKPSWAFRNTFDAKRHQAVGIVEHHVDKI